MRASHRKEEREREENKDRFYCRISEIMQKDEKFKKAINLPCIFSIEKVMKKMKGKYVKSFKAE